MPVTEWSHDFNPHETPEDFELFKQGPEEMSSFLKKLSERGEVKDYLRRAFLDPRNIAIISYYEKWMVKKVQDAIDELVREKAKESWDQGELPAGLAERYTKQELKLLLGSLIYIQPTQGCSFGCPFCGFDAACKVRSVMPFQQIKKLFDDYYRSFKRNHISLHFASEPGDYEYVDPVSGETYDFRDIWREATKDHRRFTLNKIVTRRDDPDWLKFVKEVDGARSLDNATPTRLLRQDLKGRGDGYLDVPVHAGGRGSNPLDKDRVHQKGIGLSVRKTEENIGKDNEGYERKPGSVLTPRGILYLFPGQISHEFAPQGLLPVPVGELATDKSCYDKLKTGVKLSEVAGSFIVLKMFDNNIFPDSRHAFVAFTSNHNDTGMVVFYDHKTFSITKTEPIAITQDNYQRGYEAISRLVEDRKDGLDLEQVTNPSMLSEDLEFDIVVDDKFFDLYFNGILGKWCFKDCKREDYPYTYWYRNILQRVFLEFLQKKRGSALEQDLTTQWFKERFDEFLGSQDYDEWLKVIKAHHAKITI